MDSRKLLANRANYPAPYAPVCREFLAKYAEHVRTQARFLGDTVPPHTPAELERTPLAEAVETVALAAAGELDRDDENLAAAVHEASRQVLAALFAGPGLPPAPADGVAVPPAFWQTPVGAMVASAQIWLEQDELITIAEAARLLGVGISTLAGRIDRGQLTGYIDPAARNRRNAGRLVRRSEVLAIGKK